MHRRLLDIDTMPSPEDGGGGGGGHGDSLQHGPYRKDANFDTNMVIILAALLCALICALGLNSMVRCALRCSRRWVLESGGAAEGRRAATGVKKKALKEMPVAVYGGGVEIPATECPICLGEFIDGEKVRVLPQCNHWFHVRCVDVWLASHSSCPTCRRSLAQLPAVAQLPVVAQLPAVAVGRS